MKIVKVFLKKSRKSFDIEYSYLAEDSVASLLTKGSLVKVPFGRGNRVIEAYVKSIEDISSKEAEVPTESLKYIISSDENISKSLNGELLWLANKMSERYICSRAAAIKLMTAPGEDKVTSKKVKKARLSITEKCLKDAIELGSIKKIYQIEILEYLAANGETEISEIMTKFSVSVNVVNTLAKNGYVEIFQHEKEISSLQSVCEEIKRDKAKALTEEQQVAVNELKNALGSGKCSEYLLHGVTGSGKTEVYLHIIKEVIDQGKNAIVLVPEISLTPQMNTRFKARFGDKVAILHSRLSVRERYEQWQLIKTGKVRLVVGARSAVFAPFTNIGIVIIDEEHEGTYKSETTPKYHAAEIAKLRCEYNNALLIYGSATPSIETSYKVQRGSIKYLKLKERASGIEMPEVKLIDMKEAAAEGIRGIFSEQLKCELEKNFSNREQTMLLINKRGFSYSLVCKNCSYTPQCPGCSTSMTYHASNGRVICHYCGYTEKAPDKCPNCGWKDMKQSGFGTQKVEKELLELYPDRTVIRMDMDSTKGKNSHAEILNRFVDEKIDVLIGTQMIAKGHDFANVTLVGILSADAGLNLEDFRASEKTFQLITQAAGRSGRGHKKGRVVIQAQNIDDYTIIAASKQDYRYFYTREINIRKQLVFPPFTNMAVVGFSGEDDKETYDASCQMKSILFSKANENGMKAVQILGPARYPMSKINGKYRWRIIIKEPDIERLIKLCTSSSQIMNNINLKKISGPSVDINPVNML